MRPRMPDSRNGASQKEPMYTRGTSGLATIEPSDHMSAPYTRISFCGSTSSALFRMTRTFDW